MFAVYLHPNFITFNPKNNKMKIDLSGINNIIFDLGGVILDIDYNTSIEAFRKFGFKENFTDGKLTYSDEIFYKFQTGKVTPDEFRGKIRAILNNPGLKDNEIDDAWCAMIKKIPPQRLEILKRLREGHKIFLFSNTNKIHIDRLEAMFRAKHGTSFASLFNNVFYSHEIHLAKPDVESFLKVIELSKITPAETLFIDDIKENAEGASKAGLVAHWLKKGEDISNIF
jgi:putative hydrolase of the HAD superfamily